MKRGKHAKKQLINYFQLIINLLSVGITPFFFAYPIKYNKCKYLFDIEESKYSCNIGGISSEQIKFINKEITETVKIYNSIVNKNDIFHPGIILIKETDMENMPIRHSKNAIFFIYNKSIVLYITRNVFINNTDVVHETVHYLNSINNISDPTIDEFIAKKIEQMYRNNM